MTVSIAALTGYPNPDVVAACSLSPLTLRGFVRNHRPHGIMTGDANTPACRCGALSLRGACMASRRRSSRKRRPRLARVLDLEVVASPLAHFGRRFIALPPPPEPLIRSHFGQGDIGHHREESAAKVCVPWGRTAAIRCVV